MTDERHPMLIFQGDTFKNGTFEAKFKLVKGIIETMAGLVFRYQDPQNYYYVRASGIGQSFAFFKVVNGQRGEPVMISREIETGQWYKVSVKMDGAEFTVRLNDEDFGPSQSPFPILRILVWIMNHGSFPQKDGSRRL